MHFTAASAITDVEPNKVRQALYALVDQTAQSFLDGIWDEATTCTALKRKFLDRYRLSPQQAKCQLEYYQQ